MPQILPKSAIIQTAERCAAFTRDPILRSAAISTIQDITQSNVSVTSSDPGVLLIRRVIDHYRDFLQPECYESLCATDIYVVTLPYYNAVASLSPRSIILYDGLLQLLKFRTEFSLLLAAVKEYLARVECAARLTRGALAAVAHQAQLLSIHYLWKPEPLPELSDCFAEQLKQDAYAAFCGGLLFAILHELGHLELGCRGTENAPADEPLPLLACGEAMTAAKQDEFDADAFAVQAMVPSVRATMIVNAWFVMGLVCDYEVLAGDPTDTHPFTINRILHLHGLSDTLTDPGIAASAMRIFHSQLSLIHARRAAVHPMEHLVSAEQRAAINQRAFLAVLGTAEESRNALAQLVDLYRDIPSF